MQEISTFISTKTQTYLRGYVSFRWSVAMQTWGRSQPGPCGIHCEPQTVLFRPDFFSFIIYQCSVLVLLICSLSMWQHNSIRTNLTMENIKHSSYFKGYVLVIKWGSVREVSVALYSAHHVDTVSLKLVNLFGYVYNWEMWGYLTFLSIFKGFIDVIHAICCVGLGVAEEDTVSSLLIPQWT
jgi:hypothetical protein